jgi:hypothetical protein
VRLTIDLKALGLDESTVTVSAPQIAGFQNARAFASGEAIPVQPRGGWLLVLENKAGDR